MKSGQSVLILGGAAATGLNAIQMAKAEGEWSDGLLVMYRVRVRFIAMLMWCIMWCMFVCLCYG
jgi:hypothetical protein